MSGRLLRILFHEVYHDRLFGAGRLLYNLVTGLDRARYQPTLLVSAEGVVADHFAAGGVDVVAPSMHPVLRRYDGFAYRASAGEKARALVALLGYQWRVARVIRRRGVRIVHVNTVRALYTSLLGAKLAGARVVLHLRGSMDARWRITRVGARLVDRVVASDPALIDGLPIDRDRSVVIPDGVDPRTVPRPSADMLRRDLKIPPGSRVIGSLGYVAPVKGFDVLLHALPAVWERFPEAYCVFIGRIVDDAYRSRLEEVRQALPMPDRVIFTGERNDRLELLGGFDVYVQPSLDEGFCLAVSEAMLAERAVVGSGVPGIRQQVVHGETGFLVPHGDPRELAAAIVRTLEKPMQARAMGSRGRQRILQTFTIERMVEQMQKMYDTLATERRR